MKAGRDLDVAVGRDLMGLPIGVCRNIYWPQDAAPRDPTGQSAAGHFHETIPRYSTDFNAAMEVADKLCAKGYEMILKSNRGIWTCIFDDLSYQISAVGNTPMLAVCRAALRTQENP